MSTMHGRFEKKSGGEGPSMSEVKKVVDSLAAAFDEFKSANDERLRQVEQKGAADPLLEEKVEKLNAQLGQLQKSLADMEVKAFRPGAPAGSSEAEGLRAEHKSAYLRFVRKGADEGLADLQKKALNVTTEADGGYAVPEEIDRGILGLMQTMSPMRAVCNVVQVGTPDYKRLVNVHGASTGWVDEDDARPETNTPQLAQVAAFMGEVYANAFATQTMLDDAFFNAEQWLIQELTDAFALVEGAAFVTGDGAKKPKGFLAYTQAATDDGTRAFGQVQYVATGADGAFKSLSASTGVNPADDLLTLIYKLKSGLRQGSAFMMNSAVLATARKWKDADGNYIWQPSFQAGQPSILLGYPVAENEDMPGIGSGTTPVAFGNWRRAYTIVDRIGIRTLRDPYTNKPYVGFYMTKRVGGMLVDSEAVKVLKLAAS